MDDLDRQRVRSALAGLTDVQRSSIELAYFGLMPEFIGAKLGPYLLDWANLLLRWTHVIVAIAWIGSSFYFVFLDSSLVPPADGKLRDEGATGELWAVHGGGFYNPQKYLTAPKSLPENLHWFYWESYSTWMSGFALLVVLYLFNASTFLIDKTGKVVVEPVYKRLMTGEGNEGAGA